MTGFEKISCQKKHKQQEVILKTTSLIIWRLFDVLPNFRFTTSETMGDYQLKTQYIRIESQVAQPYKTYELRKLGNIIKVSKLHRMRALTPAPQPK